MSAPTSPDFPISDHCDGRLFFNPGVDTDRSLADLWRWRRSGRRVPWPARVPAAPAPPPPREAGPGEVLLTLVGQSTVLIQVEGCNMLTDPIWSERASPVSFAGPRRVRPPGIAFDDLPRIDLVLLSHNHYDHLDVATLKRLHARSAPRIVTGLGNGRVLARHGLGRAVELDWWQCCTPARGVDVTYLPAQHWSSRTGRDRRRALWGGHAVQAGGACVYFAGDSGYGPHFAAIGRAFAPDLALLPIGAYEPRWFMQAQHMDPFDAVQAHRDLAAGLSLGIHWGTFQLTDEAIDAPLEALARAKAEAGLDAGAFLAPDFGTTLVWRSRPLPAEAQGAGGSS
ncbi:MBL fold metallo-hydrolase [Lichenibacterium ramalinae]|uniref:Metallo-hydrolase/oxidoreductase n=1 Tax=Lichenibacterium ramalinae TaxID=2316527 RepID=A0A4Q2RKZ0_9HYPH|nr:MBL fold metallo-hydrolase [Lichenibacterium ramalinae]RYB07963.1 metallo-hydrolase/oxidoreductase [Lichenibacterium ramalinae]